MLKISYITLYMCYLILNPTIIKKPFFMTLVPRKLSQQKFIASGYGRRMQQPLFRDDEFY